MYNELACYVDSAQYTNVAAWAATHAYSVGNIVRQLAAPTVGNERCFICLVAGTSVGAEPAWVLTRGAATNETTVHWMECTGLPAVNGDAANTNHWTANAGAIAVGWIIKNVAATALFICTTAGTGGTGAEPTWNMTAGATTVDGSVTWTCIGASFGAWAAPHARLQRPLDNSSSWLLNAGMNVFVGDDHTETNSTGYNWTPANSCSVLCVDHTAAMPPGSANLKTTATLSCTAGAFLSNGSGAQAYVYGITLSITGNLSVASGSQTRNRLDHCTFTMPSGGSGHFTFGDSGTAGSPVELKDCTFSIPNQNTNQYYAFTASVVRIENGTFSVPAVATTALPLLTTNNNNATVILDGCDFTGVPNTQYLLGTAASNAPSGTWVLKDCALSSGMPIYSGATHLPTLDNVTIDLNRVDGGGTIYRNERYRIEALETTATNVVRTGGAIDGTTPVSHQVVTNVNTNNLQRIFNAVPFAIWNAVIGTNRNVTVYGIVNDSRVPNNDEVWFDAEYLGSATTPKGSYVRGSKSNVLAAGTVLTVDTSAWDSQAPARANTTAYVAGNLIKTASNPGRIWFCTTAGTSAGSEPAGYASGVDGSSVTDGTAIFRAGCRFSQTLTLSSPQPQQAGYLYAYPKFGRSSMTYYLDPLIVLS